MPAGGAMTAAAIAGPVIGGIMGGMSASKARKQAAAAAAAAYAELNKVGMPPDLSKEVILQKFQEMGMLTPELEQEISLQGSEVAKIQEDPSLRGAQMEALNTLGQVSRGGLQAGDRQAYNELRAATQRDAEAKRQQVLQQMQSQGMGGSGASLIAQLQSGQAAEDTASAQGDRLAAQASQNALAALSQRSNLASGMRSQDMSAAELRAKAIDDRNRFLAENSVARQRANIGMKNEAQQANLANAQRLSELNVSQSNTEAQRQNQAKRDYFQDQLGLATAKANALNNQGTVAQQGAQAQANMYSGIGNALGQGFAAYGASQAKTPTKSTTGTDADLFYMNKVK